METANRKIKTQTIVGIGASAGGLDAIQQLFSHLPSDLGFSYMIVQHLSPNFKSLMPELLGKFTDMKILSVESPMGIEPNCIYLGPQAKTLTLEDGKFKLIDKVKTEHLTFPIDLLFHSLGADRKESSIGIVLSGTGSDGSRGIKTIKEEGGLVFVQSPDSAQFDGMPNAAMATNLVDFVGNPKELARKLKQLSKQGLPEFDAILKEKEGKNIFFRILDEVFKTTGINFKKYKTNTLVRRLTKRVALLNFNSLPDYLDHLVKNPEERQLLKQEFLIGVTSFFRDKDAFEILKTKVIPEICLKKEDNQLVRVWVAGCSTGQEVYSLAILFLDVIQSQNLNLDLKIFATDVDKEALQVASKGLYQGSEASDIPDHLLYRYFTRKGDKIQIEKSVRDKVVFSVHDVTVHPPFKYMDLISCRNLLIYFDHPAQKDVISNFETSINHEGYLFLGNSESLGDISPLFHSVDSKWKVFKKISDSPDSKGSKSESREILSTGYLESLTSSDDKNNSSSQSNNNLLSELAYFKFLTKKNSPVSVFIDKEYTIKFIQGNLFYWFKYQTGLFSSRLDSLVGKEVFDLVRFSIHKLDQSRSSVVIKNVATHFEKKDLKSNIKISKVENLVKGQSLYLLEFTKTKPAELSQTSELNQVLIDSNSIERIGKLEEELEESNFQLQTLVEELEANIEELQSSNEELMSSNEELQSANEELQSVNEELHTVNMELQEKNKELLVLNDDITNLISSSEIATLFLDTQFCIRKFTPAISSLFNLKKSDTGRSIMDFSSNFPESERTLLFQDCSEVLETFSTKEKEVQDENGNWYYRKVSPFVTKDRKIEGIIVSFVNVTNIRATSFRLNQLEYRLMAALQAGNMTWWELELPSGKSVYSDNYAIMLGYSPEEFTEMNDFMNLIHPEDYELIMKTLQNHLDSLTESYRCEYRIKNSYGEYQWFVSTGKKTHQEDSKAIIAGVSIEITKLKNDELRLKEAIKNAEISYLYKNQFLTNMSHEIRTPMNALVGFAGLLRSPDLEESKKEMFIDYIENSSKQLLNLIDDIIDVSKIETGEMKINVSECYVYNLLFELKESFENLKQKKGKNEIEIRVKVPEEYKRLMIYTDAARLRQVLTNLIGNSLKFTHKGFIEFGFTVSEDKIFFFIKDTGIGIPDEKLEQIFQRFERLNEHVAGYEGTGLGLSISRGLIQILGGEMIAESELGVGSTFRFSIPISLEKKELKVDLEEHFELSTQQLEKMKGIKILIAEDDPTNRMYMKELLHLVKALPVFAKNGIEAIDKYKLNPDVKIILMDIAMPEMNGIDAANAILEVNPEIPIIAQTAYAMTGDRENFLSKGFSEYISKPLDKNELIDKILKTLKLI